MKQKKYIALAAAPLLTAVLLLAAFAAFGLFPFGEKSVSWCDMNQQVLPLAMELKDIVAGKTDLWLNLQNAGGMSFWNILLFFVSSPVFFLMSLFEKGDYLLAANVAVVVSAALSALSAAWFFQCRRPGLKNWLLVPLSICYALSGYFYLYAQNLVWLTAMALFPVLAEGFCRLFDRGSIWLYTLALTAMMFCQFYLCYMVILFLLLAFGLTLALTRNSAQWRKDARRFGVGSGLAALLSAPAWLPALLEVQASARGVGLVESIKQGGLPAPIETTLPTVLCTGILAVGVVLALRYGEALSGEGVTAACLFALMVLPLWAEPINRIWHTGSYQAFPSRYGFITVFVGLDLTAMALEELCRRREKEKVSAPGKRPGWALLAAGAGGVCLGTAVWLRYSCRMDLTKYVKTLWMGAGGLACIALLFAVAAGALLLVLWLYRTRRLGTPFCAAVLACVLLAESYCYTGAFLTEGVNNPYIVRQALELEGKVRGTDFYRLKTEEKLFDVNLLGAAGYPNLGHYTSLTRESYLTGMKQWGYSSYWMEVGSQGGTAFTDALLQNEFIVRRADSRYDALYRNEMYQIEALPYRLPDTLFCEDTPALINGGRLEAQQRLYEQLGGEGTLFKRCEAETVENAELWQHKDGWQADVQKGRPGRLQYEIEAAGPITLYFDWFAGADSTALRENTYGSVQIFVNGEEKMIDYPSNRNNGLAELGTFEEETVSVTVILSHGAKGTSFGLYAMERRLLEAFCDRASGAPLTVNGNRLSAYYTAEKDGYLLLPLPWQEGYHFSVNGKDVQAAEWGGFMTAVPIEKGLNQIKGVFWPRGLWAGLALALLGAALCIARVFKEKRAGRLGAAQKEEGPVWLYLSAAGAAGAFIWAYLTPLVIWIFF
ncbi:MAG: YfhO family protein [Oscillospiraceae bacterium]|nr:YfhO family protein [Oscillospiraceae bacterium]